MQKAHHRGGYGLRGQRTGEAREADVGIAGGDGCGYLFVKGVPKCKVPAERMLDELLALIDTL